MTKEEKKAIGKLTGYWLVKCLLADISGMDADQTIDYVDYVLVRVQLQVVKNTLLKMAMESCEKTTTNYAKFLKVILL